MKGAADTDVPLGLAPPFNSVCIPSDDAGLVRPGLDGCRPCAVDVLGRPRFWRDCGRTPEPTLVEKEPPDVFVDASIFGREETEEDRYGLRCGPAFAVALTAALTVEDEGGAASFFLIGSAASSATDRFFDASSGTIDRTSEQLHTESI